LLPLLIPTIGITAIKRLQGFCLTRLMEGIRIVLNLTGNRMFITDLGDSIYSAKLDGSDKKMLLARRGIYLGSQIMKALKNMYEFSMTGKRNKITRSK
jgi:hypothetical protein